MILHKVKRGGRKLRILLALLLLTGILGGFFIYRHLTREEHCVMGVHPVGGDPSPETEPTIICFDSQAEVVYYLSDGRIVLPPNYTQADVWAAIEENNAYNARLEAAGNE